MEKISRKEAKELGLRRYFTGKRCVRGHVAERRVSTGKCTICYRGSSMPPLPKKKRVGKTAAEYYAANKDNMKANNQAWVEANRDKRRIIDARHRAMKKAEVEYIDTPNNDNTIITGPTNTYWEDLLNLR